MSASGSSGSSTSSNPRSRDGTGRADHPSKKRKTDGSPSDPIHWLYEHLSESIDDDYSQFDWAQTVLDRLRRRDAPRSASNLATIIRFALATLHKSATNSAKEGAALRRKLESLQNTITKHDSTAAANPVNETAAAAAAEPFLLTLESVSFAKPFGKFDVSLSPSRLTLSSKKGDSQLVIPLDAIDNVIRVVSPTSKDEIVALALKRALALGKASHDVVALKFKPKDALSVTLTASAATLKGKTGADLQAMCSSGANVSQSVAALFSFVAEKPIDMENEAVFRSMSASRTCIICHHKASHGILWPLKNGLLFGLKPLTWLPAAAIVKVDVVRASRYFELVVSVRGAPHTFNFEMIEIDEESALTRYCSLQKFGQRGGKQEALYNKETVPGRSSTIRDEPIDQTSSDDSDFVIDTSSASSIPEDYDSEVEETDSDGGAGAGSAADDDHDSENETDPNSAAGDQARRDENGLDAFAAVSGSESDS